MKFNTFFYLSVKIKLFIFFILILLNFGCSKAATTNDHTIQLGIDILVSSNFESIYNKNVGLFTNFSGRNSDGILTAEIMAKQSLFKLKYFFTPEHGFYGENHAGEKVENYKVFDIPVISLYGSSRRPDINLLKELDVVVVDIQDIGIRSYTFLSSVNYLISECAEANVQVIILDRPNPIGGNIVDGLVTEKGNENFLSLIPVPYIHGMTLGELAVMMNEEGWLKNRHNKVVKCKNLSVIKMNGWKRNMCWEDCNLFLFPTSPQIPTPDAIRGAAMLGIFGELSLFSIGIGTSLPFQYLGTPNLKIEDIYNELDEEVLNGILIQYSHFKPFYGKFPNMNCKGFIFKFPKTEFIDNFKPFTSGIKIMLAVRKVHPEIFKSNMVETSKKIMFEKVTGSNILFEQFFSDCTDEKILKTANKGVLEFLKVRKKYLIY